eukprot:TRINITY_DN2469_c0_g1_i1.p2 TRINITY_DN2469_c0_g1~~TRINITY_DN2469_c0_g1_i1.p2  ORF type:complete len:472 (-),score=136.06 TRINITY_DN2469_c0_g1_i1:474-1889(-)
MVAASRPARSGQSKSKGSLLLVAGAAAYLLSSSKFSWSGSTRAYTVPTSFGNDKRTYSLEESNILGKGAYGSVYQCEDQEGNVRAVKVIPMWNWQLDGDRDVKRAKMEQEIEVHEHIGGHDNIVKLVDSIDIEGDVGDWPRWKMVVMEIAKGGELGDLIEANGKVDEAKAKYIFKQLVEAVNHMHDQRTIHRDLKTDNILLCTDSTHDAAHPFVKLIDFGACHWCKDGTGPMEAVQCIGTLETMAPEVIFSRGDDFDPNNPDEVAGAHEAEYRTRPFGIRKYAPGPNGKGARVAEIVGKERYPKDPLGQAHKQGVQVGWAVKSVGGVDVTDWDFADIMTLMGDFLLDNSSRGAFDGSFAVSGDNKGRGKQEAEERAKAKCELPVKIEYVEPKPKPYSDQVDTWSLGCVLYNMVTGEPAFGRGGDEAKITSGTYEAPKDASPELSDLIKQMLQVNVADRISMKDLASHPWLA